MEGSLTARVVPDTSVYLAILRDTRFARDFRSRQEVGVGRVVTPTHRVWKEPGLLNDLLIALSARSVGATVITRNRGDFQLIQAFAPFRLEVL